MSAAGKRPFFAPGRFRHPGLMVIAALLLVGMLGFGVFVSAWLLGMLWAGTPRQIIHPAELILDLIAGNEIWPKQATWALLAIFLAGGALIALMITGFVRKRRARSRVDGAAKYMGKGRDIQSLRAKTALETAKRLGVEGHPGIPLGETIAGHERLYASWEDVHIDIWGPRTGKTTSRAVPAILVAPGSVLATSNKNDLVQATRGIREKAGPVWVFDPQAIAQEEQSWWWNPLGGVHDEVEAAKLAQHFVSSTRDKGARTEAFFDGKGQSLLMCLFLAAALDGRPITTVYTWLTHPDDTTPVDILQAHGKDLLADKLQEEIDAPEKQRGGIYATAEQVVSCLTNGRVLPWVTPQGESDARPQFDPEAFVDGGVATLYSLSKEGQGTAAPLVTALTAAVAEAAERRAARTASGRLPVPLVAVLDEAANVCRWADLPDLYSHYGSRGIVLMTILQSWSQGVEVWSENGMNKLWSAANIKVYGGGVSEAKFLGEVSQLIGDFQRRSSSATHGEGGGTVSRQLQAEKIFEQSDLAQMPRGRAIVMASGSVATLVRTIPWMESSQADDVRASIAQYSVSSTAEPIGELEVPDAGEASNPWVELDGAVPAPAAETDHPWLAVLDEDSSAPRKVSDRG